MRRSDQHRNSDALVRELVRQVADSAPPPPEWSAIHRRTEADAVGSNHGPAARLSLVAAIVAIVAVGLWAVARPTASPEAPARVPATVAIPAPPETWDEWVASSDPLVVQTCHARAVVRITSGSDFVVFADSVGDAGYSEPRARHSTSRGPVGVLAAVADHPDVTPGTAMAIGPVVEAFEQAEAGYFGEDAAESSPSFAADVATTEARLEGYLAESANGATCWFEQSGVLDRLEVDVGEVRSFITCLSAAQLHAAIDALDGSPTDIEIVRAAQALLALHADAVSVDLAQIGASIDALAVAPDNQRAALAASAQAALASAWSSADAPCSAALARTRN